MAIWRHATTRYVGVLPSRCADAESPRACSRNRTGVLAHRLERPSRDGVCARAVGPQRLIGGSAHILITCRYHVLRPRVSDAAVSRRRQRAPPASTAPE